MPTSIPSAPSTPAAGNAAGTAKPALLDAFASLFGSSASGPVMTGSFAACLAPAKDALGAQIPNIAGPSPAQQATIGAVLASSSKSVLATTIDARTTTVRGGDKVAPTATTETGAVPADVDAKPLLTLTRDQIETVAALLAPVLMSLQSPLPTSIAAGGQATASPSPSLAGSAIASGNSSSTSSGEVALPLSALGSWPAGTVPSSAPALAASDDSAAAGPNLVRVTISSGSTSAVVQFPVPTARDSFAETLASARQAIAQKAAELTPNGPAAQPTAKSPSDVSSDLSVSVELPSAKSLASAAATALQDTDAAETAGITAPLASTEKVAGSRFLSARRADSSSKASEKHFLTTDNELVTYSKTNTGISGAQVPRIMTDSPTFRRNAANTADSISGLQGTVTKSESPQGTASDSQAANSLLAHRAVTTVLNVVNAQDNRPATSVVNLHFKFGTDDLAVRVQMRGNEVHTQFNTDSSELRGALASEWRGVAGGNNTSGIRLADPVFATSNGSNQQLGSGAQGQSSQREFAQQQSAAQIIMPAAQAFTEEAASPADLASHPARMVSPLHTSLHLAAVA